ncbi:MAG: hypothetical protein IJ679_06625 [Lachnospiraceae bacterium]|nr:hypothetical protein [Lachnospiraceae bacterium]
MGLRVFSLVLLLTTDADYHFLKQPIYTVMLDRASEFRHKLSMPSVEKNNDALIEDENNQIAMNDAEAQETDSASNVSQTGDESQIEDESQTEEDAQQEEQRAYEKLNKIRGYVSAKREAKITKRPLSDIKEERLEKSNGTYIYANEYPKKALRPVMHAVDYGIADGTYIDPDGTTYDYPNKGVYKQNHDYYSFQKVDDDYFDDALFIGDSLTDGLHEYGSLQDRASFFAMESLTVYNIFDVTIVFRSPFEAYEDSLTGILRNHDYGKIYILLGMNEMGVPRTTDFRDQYQVVISKIRKLQPDAIIYVQGVLHVNYLRSMGDPVYNNKAVVQRNEAISKLVNGHDIFYLEPSEALCDADGNMIDEYTNDGVHPVASYYPLWHKYLNDYAIVRNEEDWK